MATRRFCLSFLLLGLLGLCSAAAVSLGCGGSDAAPSPPGPEQDAGPHGDAGSDSGPFSACQGTSLQQDGVLDFDVKTVKVTGTVTLNGKPIPAGATGLVRFVERTAGLTYSFGLKSSFQAVLAPGEYDVRFEPQTECTGSTPSAVPCIAGLVKRGVSLVHDGNVDIDIPAVEVSGQVTLNGKPLPDAGLERGRLKWAMKDGGEFAISLGDRGAKSYDVTLLPGVYGVDLTANPRACDTSTDIPCAGGPLRSDIAIQQNGNLDIDVPAVRVTGKVTLNDQPLPDVSTGRGQLVWRRTNGGAGEISLGTSGSKTFDVALLTGTYSIAYAPALESPCSSGQVTTMLPCAGARLREGLDITAAGNVDVNIPSVRVTGAIRLRGAALPDASDSRGAIAWSRDDGTASPVFLGSAGPKAFSLPLVPGTYAVGYVPNASACANDTWAFPCVAGTLKSSITIAQEGNFDVDIPAVRVTGAITLNGQPLPNQSSLRGEVLLALDKAKAGAAVIALGSTGPKSFARTILPGSYSVELRPPGRCAALTPAGVPCVGGTLKGPIALTTDGNLDIDIPVITVRGTVTLNGAPMPDAGSTRGQAVFGLLDGGQRAESLGIAPSGAASYAVTLLPGRYVTVYQDNPALCRADSPFPCSSEVVKGCP
ncbi:hypothetical protein LZC95_30895 [Pendulispora brunnea]|uniref:Carboxypeptidase regulatory-like domain-containing protein n=1 Tax=Pendulispora brunnea TaxID=2905690 RepID=A0ABZ2K259_9BACT